MVVVTSQDQARIAARYPKRSPIDYVVALGLGVGIIGMIVVVIITGVVRSDPPVVAMVRSFEVLNPSEIKPQLVVQRKDPATPARCRVYAQAETFETVGETIAAIPPGDDLLTTFTLRLSTVKEATTVKVDWCELTD